jgi:hypothetical protein
MTRNESLAGQSVKQGNYTVTYNDRGYATSAVKDNGKSATSTVKTQNANASVAHQNAYQAAQRGDWDAVGNYVNEIAFAGPKNAQGGYDFADANKYMQELQDEFKYNANDYYQGRYDSVYGQGAWDGGTGTGKPVYNEYSQSLVDAYNKNAANGVQQPTAATTTAQPNVAQNNVALNNAYTMAQSSGANVIKPTQTVDLTQYLKDMYAQDLQAQLSQLSSNYEKNAAEIKAQDDLINNRYQQAMNSVAAQNDLQKMYMNELGLVNGLNTGATGQMALAQNMAYQGNLGNLYQQQMADINANNMLMNQLSNQYSNAITQATASANSALNNALYKEMLRQEEIAREDALTQQKLAQQAQNTAREEVLTLLSNGVAPNAAMLNAANMTAEEAALWLQLATGSASNSTKTNPTGNNPGTVNPGYNNGGLTSAQVMAAQRYYGATADGLWGANSANAANGMTAEQAWEKAILPQIERGIGMNRTATGQLSAIQRLTESGELTEAQALNLIEKFGLNG